MLNDLFANVRIADLLDITIIGVLIYFLMVWLRRKTSRTVVIGIALITILYVLAHRLDMFLTSMVFRVGFTAILMALVLVFQEDIRRVFESLASYGGINQKRRPLASNQSIDALIDSMGTLARNKIGALVVLKGRENLERIIRGGVSLGGRISMPLLYSIFHPESPGHDGALIIEGDRIDRFGVYLPLSTNLAEVGEHGTRHTAGLGLSERSDSLVIIVSEEHGTISVAEQGKLTLLDSATELKKRVDRFYQRTFPTPTEKRRSWVRKNLGFKVIAALLAAICWFLFAFRAETIHRTVMVPVEYRNLPSGWEIDDIKPIEARVSFSGTERAFTADQSATYASLDVSNVREGSQEIEVTEKDISRAKGLQVKQISPPAIRVRAHREIEIVLPVVASIIDVPRGFMVSEVKVEPALVRVRMPQTKRSLSGDLKTEPVSLAGIRESTVFRLEIIVPEFVKLLEEEKTQVKVSVTLAKRAIVPASSDIIK